MALADSTGSTTAGVTLDLTGWVKSQGLTTGDKIFSGCLQGNANVNTTLTINNLNPAGTFDLIIYSDWYWRSSDPYPVTQTVGTGLTGTFWVNHMGGTDGGVPPLTEDTDPVDNGTILGNWCRIKGLTPDATGHLGFQLATGAPAYNCPFNGFQLIDKTGTTPPPLTITGITGPDLSGNFTITGTASASAKVALFRSLAVGAPLADWTQDGDPQTGTSFSFTAGGRDSQGFFILKVVP